MNPLPSGIRLCALDDIPDPGAISTVLENGADILITRRGKTIRAFVNACPHQGTPLETLPGRFLTLDKKHLLCSTHGARFHLEDGLCIHGPCKGESLQTVEIRILSGEIKTI